MVHVNGTSAVAAQTPRTAKFLRIVRSEVDQQREQEDGRNEYNSGNGADDEGFHISSLRQNALFVEDI
jgi:hypothetical protein